MSSNRPPQLHLTLPANTTSFKRSFEQFGFDLESPVGGTEASGSGSNGSLGVNDGNDRNKRARSASSLSDGGDSIQSSQSSSGASGSSGETLTSGSEMEADILSALSATRPPAVLGAPHLSLSLTHSSLEPPRLPTPELQDVEMPDYTPPNATESSSPAANIPSTSEHDEHYRISLERFNAFDSQISALRHSRSVSPPVTLARTPTPPPILPPLTLSTMSDDQDHSNGNATPFLHPPTQPSPPLPESFYSFGFPLSFRSQRSSHSSVREGRSDDPRVMPHEMHRSNSNPSTSRDPIHADPNPSSYPSRPSSSQRARSDLQTESTASHIDFSPPIWPRLSDPRTSEPEPVSFQERLDSALDVLRSPSPLLPDLDQMRPSYNRTDETSATTLPHMRMQQGSDDDTSGWEGHSNFHPPWPRLTPHRHRGDSGASSSTRAARSEGAFRRLPSRGAVQEAETMPSTNTPPARTMGSDSRSPMLPSAIWRGMDPEGFEWLEGGTAARDSPDSPSNSVSSARPIGQLPEWSWRGLEREASSSSSNEAFTSGRTPAGNGSRVGQQADTWSSSWRAVMEGLIDVRPDEPSGPRRDESPVSQLRSAERGPNRGSDSSDNSRFIDQGLLDPNEATYQNADHDSSHRSAPQLRTPVESFSPFSFAFDENDNDADRDISESERMYRMSQRRHLTPRAESDQHGTTSSGPRWSSTIPSSTEDRSPEAGPSTRHFHSSSFTAAPSIHRLRSRLHDPRPGASNSLVAENAAELRRRNARAEMMNSLSTSLTSPDLPGQDNNRVSPVRFPYRPPPLRSEYLFPPGLPPFMYGARPTHMRVHSNHTPPSNPTNAGATTRSDIFDPVVRNHPGIVHRHRYLDTPNTRVSDDHRANENPEAHGGHYPPPTGRGGLGSHVTSTSDVAHTSAVNYANAMMALHRRRDIPASSARRGFFTSPPSSPAPDTTDRDVVGQYLDPPSLPTPDLGGLFDPPTDILHEGGHTRSSSDPANHSSRAAFRSSFGESNSYQSSFRSPSPMAEDRDRRPQGHSARPPIGPPPPRRSSATYRNIDPNAYEAGPFRNTLQRWVEMDRMSGAESFTETPAPAQSHPPSLPPLTFEDDFSSFRGGASHQGTSSSPAAQSSRETSSRREHEQRPPVASPHRAYAPPEHRSDGLTPQERFWRRPFFPIVSSPNNPHYAIPQPYGFLTHRPRLSDEDAQPPTIPSRTPASDVHNYLSRRARVEASRIEPSEHPQPQPQSSHQPSRGEAEGLSRAIEVMRPDGLSPARSQQLINQFQRERGESEARRAAASSAWGTIEPGNDGGRAWPGFRFPARRPGRHEPWPEASTSRANPGSSGTTTASRHRPSSSRSPTRESDNAHERLAARPRLRNQRFRIHHPDNIGPLFAASGPIHDFLGAGVRFGRRGRAFGDYMRDEDFDESYESLLSLAATLGDAKPRATPEHIITGLPTGFYKDWATAESDHRCPICLDDYKPLDPVLKLTECSHWLHKECLEQWLRGASTCPVCRKSVKGPRRHQHVHTHQHHDSEPQAGPSRRPDNANETSPSTSTSGPSGRRISGWTNPVITRGNWSGNSVAGGSTVGRGALGEGMNGDRPNPGAAESHNGGGANTGNVDSNEGNNTRSNGWRNAGGHAAGWARAWGNSAGNPEPSVTPPNWGRTTAGENPAASPGTGPTRGESGSGWPSASAAANGASGSWDDGWGSGLRNGNSSRNGGGSSSGGRGGSGTPPWRYGA